MARNARYRVPFRRRREGKTNYHLRRKLVRGNQTRAVVRLSNSHCQVQFVNAQIHGDTTLSTAHSRELKKYQWAAGTSNLPSAYLTGFLAGVKAQKEKISSAILDIGLNPPIYGSRVFAVLKGLVDAGLEIPHSEKVFPPEERIVGHHIADYAKQLKEESKEKFASQFSAYSKRKIDPTKISKLFEQSKKEIQKAK
ncbi:MAG: 50S ribosomal protein L18 [Candidatus Hodarchaeales archaeon]|jgi:large subunit ribosomal protein L18